MSSKKVEKKPLGEPYKTKLRTQEGPTEVASTGSSSKENLKATSGQDLPSAGDGYSSDEDDVPEEFSRFYDELCEWNDASMFLEDADSCYGKFNKSQLPVLPGLPVAPGEVAATRKRQTTLLCEVEDLVKKESAAKIAYGTMGPSLSDPEFSKIGKTRRREFRAGLDSGHERYMIDARIRLAQLHLEMAQKQKDSQQKENQQGNQQKVFMRISGLHLVYASVFLVLVLGFLFGSFLL